MVTFYLLPAAHQTGAFNKQIFVSQCTNKAGYRDIVADPNKF